jgi:hypothetical protein
MNIYINDVKIDFKLENEENLGQIITNLMNFLDKQDMYIISFIIDGETFYYSQFEKIEKKSINDVNELKINALLKHELVSESSENIVKYISAVINYLKTKNEYKDEEIEKIIEGLKWCIDATNKILELFSLSPDFFIESRGKNLKTIMNLINDYISNIYSIQLDESFKDDLLDILLGYSETIVKVVSYVFVSMKGIDKNLKIKQYITLIEDNNNIVEDYFNIIDRIRDILLNGKNIESNQKNDGINNESIGLNTITKIIEFSTFYLNVLLKCTKEYLNENDDLFKEILEYIQKYTKNLESLRDALVQRDYEKVCDYFEQEIKEDLKNLKDYSIKLKDFIKNLDKN